MINLLLSSPSIWYTKLSCAHCLTIPKPTALPQYDTIILCTIPPLNLITNCLRLILFLPFQKIQSHHALTPILLFSGEESIWMDSSSPKRLSKLSSLRRSNSARHLIYSGLFLKAGKNRSSWSTSNACQELIKKERFCDSRANDFREIYW